MRAATILRICVLGSWLLTALTIPLDFQLEASLPPLLRDWVQAEEEREPSLPEIGVLLFLLSAALCVLIASVGLLFLKKWAAWLYLASNVAILFLIPVLGPTVELGIVSALNYAALLLTGMVIGLAFFSPALASARQDAIQAR